MFKWTTNRSWHLVEWLHLFLVFSLQQWAAQLMHQPAGWHRAPISPWHPATCSVLQTHTIRPPSEDINMLIVGLQNIYLIFYPQPPSPAHWPIRSHTPLLQQASLLPNLTPTKGPLSSYFSLHMDIWSIKTLIKAQIIRSFSHNSTVKHFI